MCVFSNQNYQFNLTEMYINLQLLIPFCNTQTNKKTKQRKQNMDKEKYFPILPHTIIIFVTRRSFVKVYNFC